VAVEAAAELVMESARGHALERRRRHGERVRVARAAVIAEEERRHRRPGELGRGPEAAPGGVEARRERGDGGADRRRTGLLIARAPGAALEAPGELGRRLRGAHRIARV